MKVWILLEQDWDSSEVLGVYTSEEMAEKEKEKHITALPHPPFYDCYVIKEFELQGELNAAFT